LKIYIPNIDFKNSNRKELFILTRPFLGENSWINSDKLKSRWDLITSDYELVEVLEKAQIVLVPLPINYYFSRSKKQDLFKLNQKCKSNNIKAYGYISGDFGINFPDFSNIIYFRMGGFKSQVSKKNLGFPFSVSDYFQKYFKQIDPIPISRKVFPIIGFCGHATFSNSKRIKEIAKCCIENAKRYFKNPFQKHWEILFASAFERAKILNSLEKSALVRTNFIYRKKYRAGAISDDDREKTSLEYYQNINGSDYVLCVRGGGNFSVRLYETLLMGKIPVFINTDCLLPFENQINWKNHVVWIEWKDRRNCAQIVSDFHINLSNEDFINLQINNRKLWKEKLSVSGMLKTIENDF
jgi:Exostosin family